MGTLSPPRRLEKPPFDRVPTRKLACKMDGERERRAKNEALFREVNERIEELSRRAGIADDDSLLPGFVCECSREDCTELLETTYQEYEAVRAHPRRFLVLPGHEDLEVDRVIERHKDSLVVEKRDDVNEIAIAHDPR
jgi:hypothetical protein